MSSEFIKSPLNYIGGKYKIINQISDFFPNEIDTFVDLFGGGFNVGINIESRKTIYNDKIPYLVDLMKFFYSNDYSVIKKRIQEIINEYGLSKEDNKGFLKLRNDYNSSDKSDPMIFYTLILYSFNYQIRFNNSGGYNTPHGKNRSHFNSSLDKRLKLFVEKLQSKNTDFYNSDFDEIEFDENCFVYCDPPYLVTTGSYNDGKRGFVSWDGNDEVRLLNLLDRLNDQNVRFALSNVIVANGQTNNRLEQWAKKYKIHEIDNSFNNSNYQRKSNNDIREVLITNY